MTLLVIGNILWVSAHSFKRVLPNLRNSLGNVGKGAVAISLIIALVLIVIGYKSAEYVAVWTPPNFLVHVNNILMVTAIFVFALGHTRGRLRGRLRHPMLASVKIWAVAHLLVNGDLASLILFGSMLAWAALAVILINRSETRIAPKPGTAKRDIVFVFMVVFIFLLISAFHWFFGVWPFPESLGDKIL